MSELPATCFLPVKCTPSKVFPGLLSPAQHAQITEEQFQEEGRVREDFRPGGAVLWGFVGKWVGFVSIIPLSLPFILRPNKVFVNWHFLKPVINQSRLYI